MRLLIVLSSALIMVTSSAQMVTVKEQPSFYLGKRLALEVNLNTQLSNAPQRPNKDWDGTPQFINVYFHANPEVKLTYALSNSVALYAKYGRTTSSHIAEQYGSLIYQTKLAGNSLGAGFSFFQKKKGAIAPIGRFISLGFTRHSYQLTPWAEFDFDGAEISLSKNFSVPVQNYSFDIEFGSKQLITPTIYYSISMQLTGNFGTSQMVRTLEDSKYENIIYGDLNYALESRFRLKDLAIFKLGVGAVLF